MKNKNNKIDLQGGRNKLIDIGDIIYNQIKRLDDDALMEVEGKQEIARANAITNSSTAFIKSVNVQLAIKSSAYYADQTVEALQTELGLIAEDSDEKKN